MAVRGEGLSDPNDLISAPVERVSEVVGGRPRAEALIRAVAEVQGRFLEVWKSRHLRRAGQQPDYGKLIEESYNATGIQYELAIEGILKSRNCSPGVGSRIKNSSVPSDQFAQDTRDGCVATSLTS